MFSIPGHDENIEYTICTIDFSNVVEESITQKAIFSNLGQCEIKVYGNEGKIPHFHIVNKDKKFNCPVCINDCRYFTHGSKNDTLNNEQAEELYKVMTRKSELKTFAGKSVWKVVLMAWVIANDEGNVIIRKRPPKYSDINKYPSVHE